MCMPRGASIERYVRVKARLRGTKAEVLLERVLADGRLCLPLQLCRCFSAFA